MKFVKWIMVLAIVLCMVPGTSKAASTVKVQAIGGGSSAIFLELGQGADTAIAAGSPTGTGCVWTSGKTQYLFSQDARANQIYPTVAIDNEQGNFWVTWNVDTTAAGASCANPIGNGAGTGTVNVYSYLQLDSVLGDRCFFMVDNTGKIGCLMQIQTTNGNDVNAASTITCGSAGNGYVGTAGANKLGAGTDQAGGLPCTIANAVDGSRFTYAGTDIRPEDAKLATVRDLAACGSVVYRNPYQLEYRIVYGLGYQHGGYPVAFQGVGDPISGVAALGSGSFTVMDFDISSTADPITNNAQKPPQFAVTALGAQPIIVGVSPGFGTDPISGATDINGFTLGLFYEGVLGRSTDLAGVGGAAEAVTTLVRENLSGTYNTFEYSGVNNNQFQTSQDDFNCNGNVPDSNPMNLNSANGAVVNGSNPSRQRVIGTSNMVAQLNAAAVGTPRLGYFFWSAANANGLNNVKYLTVNGADPILSAYGVGAGGAAVTPGALPQSGGAHPAPNLGDVTFGQLNKGDYPIWSVVRLVSSPGNGGVANLASGLHILDATQNDYISLANLNVWHSHFPLYGIAGNFANGNTINVAGDLCNTGGALAEAGGDAGGTNVLKTANADFCSDFANTAGLANKQN